MDVADGQRPEDEARTELIPAVETGQGIGSTRELPAVDAEPDPAISPAPAPAPPVDHANPDRSAPAPDAAADRAPGQSTATSSPSLRTVLTGAIVVVLVAVVAVAGWKIGTGGGSDQPTGGSSAAPARSADPTVSSLDPSGGSGFRRSGSSWTTQTYTSATFGNLKKGVGLVLDLGQKQSLDQVSFTSTGPTVSLRAADSTDQLADGSTQVGDETVASGATTLKGEGGGEHRYWMIWVSKLAASDGGYSAQVGDIAVEAG